MTSLALLVLMAVPWSSTEPVDRSKALAELHAQPPATRVVTASERFLGTPYLFSPLGEGEGHDADPLIRFDAVDCVTFVEEVMAMSMVASDEALIPTLNRIRYSDGKPQWNTRNHITEAQWVPNNVKAGFLKDVTAALAGAKTVKLEKTLSDASWTAKEGASLGIAPEHQVKGTFTLDAVSSKDALEVAKNAPSGLVVVVIRADKPKSITRVSHVGLLIQTPEGPVFRHASRSYKKVTDEPFAHYLKRNRDFGAWTISGVAFFEVQNPEGAAL